MGDTVIAPADIIAAHQPQDLPSTQCRCGLDLDPDDNSQSQSWDGLHAQHVLAALQAAGYEVVELPADDNGGLDDNGQLYFDDYAIRVDNTGPSNTVGDIYTDFAMGSEFKREITPRQCRSLAAALLAAANAAEEAK